MALCGGLTNMIGNAVAVLVIARWEGAFDRAKFDAACGRSAADAPAGFDYPAAETAAKP